MPAISSHDENALAVQPPCPSVIDRAALSAGAKATVQPPRQIDTDDSARQRVVNPTLGTDAVDTFGIGQQCRSTKLWLQVVAIGLIVGTSAVYLMP